MVEENETPDIGYKVVPKEEMSGYTYCPNDLCVSRDALRWDGLLIENNGNNAVVAFHEGRNALAPLICTVQSLANVSFCFCFPKGVELDNGLFVDFDDKTTSVTVFWRPRREREAG